MASEDARSIVNAPRAAATMGRVEGRRMAYSWLDEDGRG